MANNLKAMKLLDCTVIGLNMLSCFDGETKKNSLIPWVLVLSRVMLNFFTHTLKFRTNVKGFYNFHDEI